MIYKVQVLTELLHYVRLVVMYPNVFVTQHTTDTEPRRNNAALLIITVVGLWTFKQHACEPYTLLLYY